MNIKKFLIYAAMAATAVMGYSCGGQSTKKLIKQGLYNCNDRLRTAEREMDKLRYSYALRILEELRFQCGGSEMMDTVYYYTAMAYFRQKQYEEARFEFESLYREYPRSHFAEEALFRIAHMRYMRVPRPERDQAATRETVRLLTDYMEQYSDGIYADSAEIMFASSLNRLAEKEYGTARFYRRQRKHEAALIYYRSVLSEYPDSRFAPSALVGMAEMLVTLGRTQDAGELIEELNAEAFEEELRIRIEAVRQSLAAGNS